MSNGRPWTEEHTATLRRWSGREPDAAIGKRTGHCADTIREKRSALGLPAYRQRRRTWTRREWLLYDAAGLSLE